MRKTLAWTALALILGAATGSAKTDCVPSPVLSSGPRGIALVGQSGSPDPIGAATYVVRDIVGTPVPGSTVVLDFSNCSDVRIASAPSPGVFVDCASRTVRGISDNNGSVTFRVVGSATGGPPRTLPACAAVMVDGVPLPAPIISSFDLDGMNGVDGLDLSIFRCDFFSGQYRPRSDYDFDGDVDGVDLGLFARALFGGGSTASGTPCSP